MEQVQNGLDKGAWSSRVGSGEEGIPRAGRNCLLSGKSRLITTESGALRHENAFRPVLAKRNALTRSLSSRLGSKLLDGKTLRNDGSKTFPRRPDPRHQ